MRLREEAIPNLFKTALTKTQKLHFSPLQNGFKNSTLSEAEGNVILSEAEGTRKNSQIADWISKMHKI